jgi:hypothetical protein
MFDLKARDNAQGATALAEMPFFFYAFMRLNLNEKIFDIF